MQAMWIMWTTHPFLRQSSLLKNSFIHAPFCVFMWYRLSFLRLVGKSRLEYLKNDNKIFAKNSNIFSAPSNSADSDSTETSHLIGAAVPGEEQCYDNHIGRNIISPHQPTDKYHLVYLIVLLHGIGVLLPWNTFLTIATDVIFMAIWLQRLI